MGSVELPAAYAKHKVVPDVLPVAPEQKLQLVYSHGIRVDLGNELTPTNVVKQPVEINWNFKARSLHTLIMCDPDSPNPEWLHWLVINIPGSEIKQGEEVVQYVGAAPPKKSGLHRYVFIIYEHSKKLDYKEKMIGKHDSKGRSKFSTSLFAKKYYLGNPIAGNFFLASYDATCDTIYRQFK